MKTLFILLILTITSFSQSLVLESFEHNAEIYHNVKLEKISSIEARITHNDGVKRILATDLSDDLKNKLGFDKLEIDKHVSKIADINKRNEEFNQKLKTLYAIRGTISQVTDKGILINDATIFKFKEIGYFTYTTTDTSTIGFETLGKSDVFVYGSSSSVDGEVVNYLVEVDDNYTFTTVLGASRCVRGLKRCPKEFTDWFNTVIVTKGNEIVNKTAQLKLADGERKLLLLKEQEQNKNK
jgi:hypothetical protein